MNVFVSRPTRIDELFEAAYQPFHAMLEADGIHARRLGGGDYSRKAPLQAVIDMILECHGAIVLGYPQLAFEHWSRRGPKVESSFRYLVPTPWNQIEGALAYSARAPTLVVAHPGVEGGVFDHGITGEAVIAADLGAPDWHRQPEFVQPYREWLSEVRAVRDRRSAR